MKRSGVDGRLKEEEVAEQCVAVIEADDQHGKRWSDGQQDAIGATILGGQDERFLEEQRLVFMHDDVLTHQPLPDELRVELLWGQDVEAVVFGWDGTKLTMG